MTSCSSSSSSTSLDESKVLSLLSSHTDICDTLARHASFLSELSSSELSATSIDAAAMLTHARRCSRTISAPPVGWTPGFSMGQSHPPLVLPEHMRASRFAAFNRDAESEAKARGETFSFHRLESAAEKRSAGVSSIARHSDVAHLSSLAQRLRASLSLRRERERERERETGTAMEVVESKSTEEDEAAEEAKETQVAVESKARESTISFFDFGEDEEDDEED